MYLRCAYFEGNVAANDRERFESIVREQVTPKMLEFPRIRSLKLLWGREQEVSDRGIYLAIEHEYDSLEDLHTAITSDVRAGMKSAIDELVSLFEGRIYHVNYEAETSS
jgi:hypothetical protein